MKKKGPCKFNLAIDCDGSDCSRCGWCPSVEERSLSDLRGSDALTAEKITLEKDLWLKQEVSE